MPSMVAALMTPLMPGAGPPPTRIASLPRLMLLAISLGQQIADERIFFLQLVDGRVNPRPAEVVDGETLDNFELLAIASDGEGADQALLHAVAAIGANTQAVPIPGWRRFEDRAHAVHNGVGGATCAGNAARFDHRRAALLDRRDKIALEPGFIGDDLRSGAAIDFRVVKIRVLRGGVIAPDAQIRHGRDFRA